MFDIDPTLDRFLRQKEQKVLLISGAWGVGKTYHWKEFIAKRKRQIVDRDGPQDFFTDCNSGLLLDYEKSRVISDGIEKYAYVSLFGHSTLSEIKASIVLDWNFGMPHNKISKLASIIANLKNGFKAIPKLKEWAGAAEMFSDAIPYFAISDMLICFDDFERMEKALTLSTLLGYISELREEKNCKVVMILNADQLGESKVELDKYREKIIDVEIEYSPTVERNLSLVFNVEMASEAAEYRVLLHVFRYLEINNIRLMRQTKWRLEYILNQIQSMGDILPSIMDEIFLHVGLYCIARYDPNPAFSLEDLSRDPFLLGFHLDEAKNSDESTKKTHGKLSQVSSIFGYVPAKYDEYICSYLLTGALDSDGFADEIKKRNALEKASAVTERLQEIYSLARANFRADAKMIVDQAVAFLDQCSQDLTINQVNALISFLETFGVETGGRRSIWIDASIEAKVDTASLSALEEFKNLAGDAKLRERIDRQIGLQRSKGHTIWEIVYRMCENGSWSRRDIEELIAFETPDYERCLREEAHSNLLEIMKMFLTILRSNSDPNYSTIRNKIETAARTIGRESLVNKLRVEKMLAISLEESDSHFPDQPIES